MAKFKKGSEVRKVVPDIEGAILNARLDADMEIEYLVEYKTNAGQKQQRWFKEVELEAKS